jgi:hypothetical protein
MKLRDRVFNGSLFQLSTRPLGELLRKSEDDHFRRLVDYCFRLFGAFGLFRQSLHQRLRNIQLEIGSFRGRISIQNGKNLGVVLGPGFEKHPTQHLVRCRRTRARILDMQSMRAQWPWASTADLQIFLVGWDKGAEWVGRDNADSCISQQDIKTSSAS